MQRRLIIYAKRPFPGYAKTRLGSALGAEPAAGVYARLLYAYLLSVVHRRLPDTTVELSVANKNDCAYFRYAFPEFIVRPQVEGDLGARMADSFDRAFAEGAEAVVLTGSDIPGLTVEIVDEAFGMLAASRAGTGIPGVIGPAADGGYYLIGMRAPGANLFEGIAWSTQTVLPGTQALAVQKGVRLAQAPQLADLDVMEEYAAWRDALGSDKTTGRLER